MTTEVEIASEIHPAGLRAAGFSQNSLAARVDFP